MDMGVKVTNVVTTGAPTFSKTCKIFSIASFLIFCIALNLILFKPGDNVHSIVKYLNNDIEITRDNDYTKMTPKQPLVWLNRSGAEKYNNYGDGSCPPNKDMKGYTTIMKKWLEIVHEHNIEYFLSFGSLLGAWRDEQIIPWDGDMDVHMRVDQFHHIAQIADREPFDSDDGIFHIYVTKDWRLPYKLRRRHNCNGKQSEKYSGQCSFIEPFARLILRGDHLDLFVYTTYYDTLKFLPDDGDEFIKSDVFPLSRCMYMGLEFVCPNNAKAMLDVLYNKKLLPRDLCYNGTFHRNEIAYKTPV